MVVRSIVVAAAISLATFAGATATSAAEISPIPATPAASLCAAQSGQAFQDGSGFYACFVPPTADFSERELRVARVLCELAYRGAFIEPGFTRAYVCTGLG
jgi:hypothetical protein